MRMKNKKAEQQAARERHREQLRLNRRAQQNLERAEPAIVEKPTILIVCEGQNTEPSYFNQFRLSTATVVSIGEGYSTDSLVRRAKELSQEKQYDQVWCVFDADPIPDNPHQSANFNRAIQQAEANGFGVAYSNQAFEYWLILHFNDHQGGKMDRAVYDVKLNKLLKPFAVSYDGKGSKRITEELFDVLDKRKLLAISRAKRNYNRFDHTNPAMEESSTTIFRLVEELLKFI
jgi:RloB-like protein